MPISFDPNKPLVELRAFANALGWRGLEMWQHTLPDGMVVTWHSTSDTKFFLQINEHPLGQTERYAAAVYADRYGICTGCHRFALGDERAGEALAPWLLRQQFKDRNWRREFRMRHPECCIDRPTPKRCNSAKLRGKWPPHWPDDAQPVSAAARIQRELRE